MTSLSGALFARFIMEKHREAFRACAQVYHRRRLRFIAQSRLARDSQVPQLFEICSGARVVRRSHACATESGSMNEASTSSIRRNLRSQDNVAR